MVSKDRDRQNHVEAQSYWRICLIQFALFPTSIADFSCRADLTNPRNKRDNLVSALTQYLIHRLANMDTFYRKAHFPVLISVVCLSLSFESARSYVLPEIRLERLQPRGIQVSIPDIPGTQFFAFHANVNKGISGTEDGEISGQMFQARDGRWTVRDTEVNLADGDVVNYWYYVQGGDSAYKKDDQSWTVQTTLTKRSEGTIARTGDSITTRLTQGNVLFEELFHSLNKSRWMREIKMPIEPDYEFCVYHNENHQFLAQVENGILRITPLILEDYYGEDATSYGRLTLSGCTSTIEAECSRHAVSYSILPPIISARFTTKNSFSFKYGKIEIRAKFPEGDWIYPEMWLEPKYPNYGDGYASGRILLGYARGNENFMNMGNGKIYDSRRLDFGLRVGMPDSVNEHIVSKMKENSRWTQDFHMYTTIWTAEGFQFLVDGEEVGRLRPGVGGWLDGYYGEFSEEKKAAPFDQEFYITIGVGVGGVRVFPDGTKSAGVAKPWKNNGAKAMLKFWRAKNQWLPSWRQHEGRRLAFEIDHIRVWSL